MTPEELAGLREIAEAANTVAPGPWKKWGERGDVATDCKGWPQRMVAHALGQDTTGERQTIREFMAVFNPATALALLDALTALSRELEEARKTFRTDQIYIDITTEEIRKARAETERLRKAVAGLRCRVTQNPVGTDTWMVGHPCRCNSCQTYLLAEAALVVPDTASWSSPPSGDK